MSVLSELWAADVSSEMVMKESVKLQPQLKYAATRGIPIVVMIGKEGLEKGTVRVYVLCGRMRENKKT